MWFDWIEGMATSIRQTESWTKFKIFYKRLLDPIYARYCTKHKNLKPCFCEKYHISIKNRLQSFDTRNVEKHCEVKEPGCRNYCEKYCDHFNNVDCYGRGGSCTFVNFKCPTNSPANATDHLLPIQQDIDDFLTNSLDGKSCLE